jgi:hypothetical protein
MAVKPQDIQGITEKYLVPDKMALVVVGDKAKIADQVKPYETVSPQTAISTAGKKGANRSWITVIDRCG